MVLDETDSGLESLDDLIALHHPSAVSNALQQEAQPVDGIPWMIHATEPEYAYQIALDAYLKAQLPNDPPQDPP